MKRISFLLLVLSTTMATAAEISESVESTRPRIGVQVGATFNDVSGPKDMSADNRTGLAAGVRVAIPLNPYLSIQPEAIFVQRGVTFGGGAYNLTAKYNTIEVPVLLKASLPLGLAAPYLVAGPMAFFNISRSITAGTPAGAATANFDPQTVEFGASLGAGVDVGPVFVAANYLLGLSNLDANSTQYQSRGVQLMGGVSF